MAKEFKLSAVLEFKDKMAVGIRSARQNVSGLKSSIDAVKTNGMQSELTKAGTAADKLGKQANGLKSALAGVEGEHHIRITAQDHASEAAYRAANAVKAFSATGSRSANLRANDEATPVITRLKERLEALTGKAYNVSVRANGAGGAGLLSKLGGAASGVAGGMLMNTSMQMAGAAGVGYGLYDMIKSAADFEQGMSGVAAISGASGEALQKLTDKALEMGQQTKFTATESSQALNYMAMAGWKTDEMLSGLPGVMNLAAASGEDLAMVSDIVTDSMTAFKVPAEESAHFADVLAATAANANTNVGKMGYTFKYAGAFAGALGYSIEDVALATGAMADAGVKSETAGTSLRALMQRLSKPTKESADAMQELGVQAFDPLTKKARPLREVLDDLREKFKGLSEQDKTRLGAELAGADASSGFLGMMNVSQEKWDQIKNAVDNADGAAQAQAAKRMDNLAGSLTLLGSAWETFSIKLMKGTGAANGIRSFVDEVTKLVTNFTKRIETDGLSVKSVLGTIGEGAGDLVKKFLALDGVGSVLAGGALAAGLFKISTLTKSVIDGLGGFFGKGAAGKAAGGLGGFFGKGAAGKAAGALGGASMSEMVVNATTVIVNGNVASGAASSAAEAAGAATAAGAKGGRFAGLGRFSRLAGRIAAPLALAAGIYDVATAEEGQRGAAASGAVGGLAGGFAGAKLGALAGGAIGSFIPVIGTAAGAVVGGAVGGIGGAVAGSNLGQAAWNSDTGQWIRNGASNNAEYAKNGITNNAQYVGNGIKNNVTWMYNGLNDGWNSLKEGAASAVTDILADLEPLKQGALDVVDFFIGAGYLMWQGLSEPFIDVATWFIENVGVPIAGALTPAMEEAQNTATWAWNGISETAASAAETVSEVWTLFTGTMDGIWAEVQNTALWAWNGVTNTATWAWNGIVSIWNAAAEWFEATVWTPLKSAVESVRSSFVGAFNGALATIKGAWAGITGWFEANVIGPIRQKIQSVTSIGTSIRVGLGFGGSSWTGESYFVPSFATGGIASFASGNVAHGLAQINEHGGELIDLPQGSRIYPAATTERLIERQLDKETPTMPNINITGNSFTVREEADIQKIAYEIARQIMQAEVNFGGAY